MNEFPSHFICEVILHRFPLIDLFKMVILAALKCQRIVDFIMPHFYFHHFQRSMIRMIYVVHRENTISQDANDLLMGFSIHEFHEFPLSSL